MAWREDEPEYGEPPGLYGGSLLKLLIWIGTLARDCWGEPFGGIVVGLELEAEELRRLRLRDSCETVRSSGDSSRGSEIWREGGLGEMRFPSEYSSSPSCNKTGLGQRGQTINYDAWGSLLGRW